MNIWLVLATWLWWSFPPDFSSLLAFLHWSHLADPVWASLRLNHLENEVCWYLGGFCDFLSADLYHPLMISWGTCLERPPQQQSVGGLASVISKFLLFSNCIYSAVWKYRNPCQDIQRSPIFLIMHILKIGSNTSRGEKWRIQQDANPILSDVCAITLELVLVLNFLIFSSILQHFYLFKWPHLPHCGYIDH